ncbi:DedA family protein [Aurantiacibacter aquimixticola]|uniref:DedA family protein n=1 Tax=Aurantiacibacter aquimixticola TaxID=1958945 RepID=A0A419RRR1_9SPHN|nr:DedA family protein [Aurantiacibacter aquimixticola]RJY08492.1 DedA family protein [Aurantiacibacter aquimixticola]
MDDLIIDLIERGGYLGIFLLMALENIVPPVPSEVIMGVGGLLVQRGAMDFWPLLLIGTAGTTAGNYAWYWVGDKWGYERLRPFIDRWGRWLTVDWEHMAKAQVFFHSWGHWVVFVLRFSPFLRTMISLPAGLAHMPLWKFIAFTFVGSLVWNAALILAGQWLARYLEQSQGVIGWIIIGCIVLAIAAYLWRVFTWVPRAERDD